MGKRKKKVSRRMLKRNFLKEKKIKIEENYLEYLNNPV